MIGFAVTAPAASEASPAVVGSVVASVAPSAAGSIASPLPVAVDPVVVVGVVVGTVVVVAVGSVVVVVVSAADRSRVPVSIAGFSTLAADCAPGSTIASCMPSGASPEAVTALICTSSTWPTYTGSVPGRVRALSSLPASGPCSSWYGMVCQGDQVPFSSVRTETVMASSGRFSPCFQVTPTVARLSTACGAESTVRSSVSGSPSAATRRAVAAAPPRIAEVPSRRAARPALLTPASGTAVTRGFTGAEATSDGLSPPPTVRWALSVTGAGTATDPGVPGRAGATMSRVTVFTAGAAIATTTASARLCWHRSTKRLLFSGIARYSCGSRDSHEYQMSQQPQRRARASK